MNNRQSPGTNGNGSPARAPVRKLVPIEPKPTVKQTLKFWDEVGSNALTKFFGLTSGEDDESPTNGDQYVPPVPTQNGAGTPKILATPPLSKAHSPQLRAANGNGRASPPKPLSKSGSREGSPKHLHKQDTNGSTKYLNGDSDDQENNRIEALKLIEEILQITKESFIPIKRLTTTVMNNIKTHLNGTESRSVDIKSLSVLRTHLNNDKDNHSSIKDLLDRFKIQFPQRYKKEDLLHELKNGVDTDSRGKRILAYLKNEIESDSKPFYSSTKYREEYPTSYNFFTALFEIYFSDALKAANKKEDQKFEIRERKKIIDELENKRKELEKAKETALLTEVFAPQPIAAAPGIPDWIVPKKETETNLPSEKKTPTVSAVIEKQPSSKQEQVPQPLAEPENTKTQISVKVNEPINNSVKAEKKEIKISIQDLPLKLVADFGILVDKARKLQNSSVNNMVLKISQYKLEKPSLDSEIQKLNIDETSKEVIHTIFQLKVLQEKVNELDLTQDVTLLDSPDPKEEWAKYAEWITSIKNIIVKLEKVKVEKVLADVDSDEELITEQKKAEAAKSETMRKVEAQKTEKADGFLHPKTPHSNSRRPSVAEGSSLPKDTFVSIATSEEKPEPPKSDEGDAEHIHHEGGEGDDEDKLLNPKKASPSSSPRSDDSANVTPKNNRNSVRATKEPDASHSGIQNQPNKKSFADRLTWTPRLGIGGAVLFGLLAVGALLIPFAGVPLSIMFAKMALSSASVAAGVAAGVGITMGITAGAGAVGGAIGACFGYAIDTKCKCCKSSTKKTMEARTPRRKNSILRKEQTNSSKLFDRVGNASAPVNISGNGPDNNLIWSGHKPATLTYTPPPQKHLRGSDEENRSSTPSP